MHEGHRQRLREAYPENGLSGMADHNGLKLILTYTIPRRDVNPLAHRLIDAFGSLSAVLSALTEAAELIGISVLDQLTVGGNAVYSIRYDRVFVCRSENTCVTETVDKYRPGPSPRLTPVGHSRKERARIAHEPYRTRGKT